MLLRGRRLILVGEIVTNSPLGEDEFGLGGIPLDLLPQAADVHVHGALFNVHVAAQTWSSNWPRV